jgi:hypothetical protein
MKIDRCESCEINQVEVKEDIESGPPYQLCKECHHRLVNLGLRPLEYFNLTAKHGYTYLLHDDFYDDKTGEACASKIDVIRPEDFPFPSLDEIRDDLERLIDYAIVQYFINDETLICIKQHDKTKVLETLDQRLAKNKAIIYKLLEIAAKGLEHFAEKWVRQRWNEREKEDVSIFAEALAKCLPFDESFSELTREIEKEEDKKLPLKVVSLIYFERPETLDWIEKMKSRITSVSDSWGNLTAASKLDWSRTKKWLDDGRPLSLIALDALIYCTTTGPRLNQIPWFKEHPPKLINPAKLEVITQTINDYVKRDSVRRVRNSVNKIVDNLYKVVE